MIDTCAAARPRFGRALQPPRAAILVALALGGCGPSADTLEPDTFAADSAAIEEVIVQRRALIESDALFLELDAVAGTLTLMQGGTPLRAWSALSVEAGPRRLEIGRGDANDAWRQRVWPSGALLPERRIHRPVLVAAVGAPPPDPSGAVDFIPPPPEEAVPAPARFSVRYADGLGLRVVSSGEPAGPAPGLTYRRLGERIRAALPWRWDRYRIEVTLTAAEAGALYRSLPDGIPLIAVLPDPPRD